MQFSKSQQVFDIGQIQNSQTAVDLQLRHFKGEAFSDNEKQTYLSIMKILSVLLVAFSFPLTALGVYYVSIINIFFLILLIASGSLMIILGIATFHWANAISLKIFKNQNSTQKAQLASSRYGQILFISSISLALYNFIIILFLYNWVQDSYDTYIASHGAASLLSFQQNYNLCLLICWSVLVINEVIILTFIYYEFIISIGLLDLRLVSHYFNVVQIGFSLSCIWSCKKATSYFSIHGMSEYANKNYVDLVYLLSFFSLGLSLFNYVVIVRKKRQEYMWMGTVLILFCCLLSAFNHLIYRDGDHVLNGFQSTWFYQMPNVSKSYMLDEMKCNKYISLTIENESIYSLHCNPDYQTMVWEDNYNLKVDDRLYQTACLNQDCQGVLANSYSVWYYRLNIFLLCQIASYFLIAIVFYQISLVMNRKKPGMDNSDYFFGFSTILVIASVLTYIYFYDFIQPPQLNSGNIFTSFIDNN